MQTELSSKRQINHKVMRAIVGFIALALSPVVWLLSGSDNVLTSISISYWTDSRDIFVGSLVAIGFFLSAYNGSGDGRDWEYYLSKVACIFAICVAIFPTEGFSDEDIPAKWVQAIAEPIGVAPGSIHNGAAILLFGCLIVLMWFFSVRAMKKSRPGRAYFYRGVSISIGAGIIGILVIGKLFKLTDTIFWVESWGLTLFGIGWLAAGIYRSDNHTPEALP